MSGELFLALLVFVTVTLFTPGPNNVMLMTSGVNFGFARTQAHVWGVTLGFAFMVLVVGVGLGALFDAVPLLYTVLKYVSIAYLLYLAWMIANAGPVKEGEEKGKPLTFMQAAAFQWVNPKGWIMAIGAISTYAAILSFPFNVLLITGLFGAVGILSCLAWAAFGASMRRLLRTPRAVRIFNIAMALALIASIAPVLFE